MCKWSEFYKGRNCKGYRDYFKNRYSVLIDFILGEINDETVIISEEGCGAGHLTYSLLDHVSKDIFIDLSDISADMLIACRENLHSHLDDFLFSFMIKDILKKDPLEKDVCIDVLYSHGVLEHFSNNDIRKIISNQTSKSEKVIHYVPSAKYKDPSFGDERLMTPEMWNDICSPTEIVEFNRGYDLILYWD